MPLRHRRHWAGACLTAVGVAVIAWHVTIAGQGQAAAPPKQAAINGLQAKFVDVKAFGVTIKTRYYEVGQGEPMVLAHGGGFEGYYSANHWSKNIPGLGKKFHVFAADKLSSGMTDNPQADKDFSIYGEAEHMYQFIQTMKLGKVHLVGQSRGAGLVLLLAVAHPEVVKTLVLVDSGTASPEEACPGCAEAVRAKCPSERVEAWKCTMRGLSFRPDVAFDEEYFAAGIYMAGLPKSKATVAKKVALAKTEGPDANGKGFGEDKKALYERLKKGPVLPMPILLYWAKNDPQAPALKNGVALYDILTQKHSNVRMLIQNEAGHFFFREYPDEFNYNVASFVEYWSRQSAGAATAKTVD